MKKVTYTEAEIMAAMAEFYRRSDGDEITPENLLYHLRRLKKTEPNLGLCKEMKQT